VFRIAGLFLSLFLFVAPLLKAANLTEDLFHILQLVDEKNYPDAIASYEQYMRAAPPWFQGPIQFEIATLHAAQGQNKQALSTMEDAIQSGFDDCLAIQQYPEWNSLKDNFQFATLHSEMRISEADFKELAWLKAEIENVKHDAKMMMTEDINRVDTNFTQIPKSEIPTRQTTSPAVLFTRELLKAMHEAQRYYVNAADKERIEHVVTMGVISGTSNDEMLNSTRLAEQAAARRRLAIEQRKFSIAPSAGTEPRSCIEFK
jgi:tetratricopeptide (TPR) repeat protein